MSSGPGSRRVSPASSSSPSGASSGTSGGASGSGGYGSGSYGSGSYGSGSFGGGKLAAGKLQAAKGQGAKGQSAKGKGAGATGKGGKNGGSRPRVPRAFAGRRQPTSGWPLLRYRARLAWERALEAPWLWILVFVAIGVWSLVPRRLFWIEPLDVGSIAPRTYVADRLLSVPDEAATRELAVSAQDKVLPVYDLDRGVEIEARLRLSELFAAGRAVREARRRDEADDGAATALAPAEGGADAGERSETVTARLAAASGLPVTGGQAEVLARRGFSTDLEDRLHGIVTRILRQGVVADKALLLENRVRGVTVRELPTGERRTELDLYGYLDYPEEVSEVIERELNSWDALGPRDRRELGELIFAAVAPNLTLNRGETLAVRAEAQAEVGNVLHQIRRGEVIVRRGDLVDEVRARAIHLMVGTRELGELLQTIAGALVFVAGVVLLLWLRTGQERSRERSRPRMLSEALVLLAVHVLVVRFGVLVAASLANTVQREPFASEVSYTFAIPFAALAMTLVLLYGRTTAGVISVVFALMVGRIAGDQMGWTMAVYALAGSLAAVHALDRHQFRQRSTTNRAGAVVGLVNVLSILMLRALDADFGTMPQLAFDLVCGFAGGVLTAALVSFAVPVFELALSATTHIKLVELANPNLPLLRRLAFEAPGSFQHSLAVANLSKAGCEAIDADSVLVHTCALYHDIGKIFRPQYFIENQMGGQNPHDKIQPSMSALIIINHVKDGLDLAVQHNLPQPLFDAIEQHHGTRLITFFLNRARERCDPDTEEIREEEFRYPGPKPQTKEMGVLMLADAIEAASRTLVEPSRQKLRTVVRAIFDDSLRDGQLDQTDLSLGDLRRVEDAFLRVLTNVYHRRVDYPGFDFNRGEGRKRRPPVTENGDATGSERRKAS